MTRYNLATQDIALLGRLTHGPCELGDFPIDRIERLTALGLATTVLGCCEITRAGQLAYHRHQYSRGSRGRIARVEPSDPNFLQENGFPATLSRNQLFTFSSARRSKDASAGRDVSLPQWLRRFVLETAHRVRGKSGDKPSKSAGLP